MKDYRGKKKEKNIVKNERDDFDNFDNFNKPFKSFKIIRWNIILKLIIFSTISFRDELHYVNLNLIISYENLYNLIIVISMCNA